MTSVKHTAVLDLAERRSPVIWNAVLLVGLVAAGLALLYLTRNTTFLVDEWIFVQDRRGWDAGTFLEPHNEHLALVPVAVYKLLFETVGLDSYLAYRLLVTATHLGCVALLYVYARRRVDAPWAALLALLLLLFGPGWQNILWPFQFAWILSVAAGIGAFLALEGDSRRDSLTACFLLAVSVASSGVGLAFLAGCALELLLARRRDAWVFLIPLAAYALWWLTYGESGERLGTNLFYTPWFAANVIAATVAGVVGLGGDPVPDRPGTLLDWGPPLLLVAGGALAWRFARVRPSPRVLALLTVGVGFVVLTGLGRAAIAPAETSRYLYVVAACALLLTAEQLRGLAVRPSALAIGVAVVALAVLSNVGVLREAGAYLRGEAQAARADLAAVELARAALPRDYRPGAHLVTPFVDFRADRYLAAARDYGSAAATPAEITGYGEPARRVTDNELVAIYGITPRPLSGRPRLGAAPAVEHSSGVLGRKGPCLTLRAPEVAAAGVLAEMDLVAPRGGGVLVRAAGGPATVSARRFADRFLPRGTADGAPVAISAPADASDRPWRVRIETAARATACGLVDMP